MKKRAYKRFFLFFNVYYIYAWLIPTAMQRHQFYWLSLSFVNDVIVALHSLSMTAELLISVIAKTARANKVADFYSTIYETFGLKNSTNVFDSLTLPGPTGIAYNMDRICILEKSLKCCMDALCTWVKL